MRAYRVLAVAAAALAFVVVVAGAALLLGSLVVLNFFAFKALQPQTVSA